MKKFKIEETSYNDKKKHVDRSALDKEKSELPDFESED